MKKLTFVLLALSMAVTACDRDAEEVSSNIESIENTAIEVAAETTSDSEEALISPADMSEDAQNVMYQIIFDYNQCMMSNRLKFTQQGQSAQQTGNEIMASCETHMDSLQTHLLANDVNESLVIGMTKKMRSRAARQLMTQGMNQMAAQAAAAANADQMEAE